MLALSSLSSLRFFLNYIMDDQARLNASPRKFLSVYQSQCCSFSFIDRTAIYLIKDRCLLFCILNSHPF